MKPMRFTPLLLLLSLLAGSVPARAAAESTDAKAPAAVPDEPVAAYRVALLELSHEAASAYPLVPHIKNRSRAQQRGVEAAIELGQLGRAERYAKDIANYRRGRAFASVAAALAERGEGAEARRLVAEAEQIADTAGIEPWRRANVRVEMARALAILGETERAEALLKNSPIADAGDARGVAQARLRVRDDFDSHFQHLTAAVRSDEFFRVHAGLWGLAGLFDIAYEDAEKRDQILAVFDDPPSAIPGGFVVEAMVDMTDTALQHEDRATAGDLLERIEAFTEGKVGSVRYGVPLQARLGELTYRNGQEEEGLAMLEAALSRYEGGASELNPLWRPEVLRPVAEGFAKIGDHDRALAVYRRVVELGAENPNLRPRIDELTATCLSMAVRGVEPDAALFARLRNLTQGLEAK